jgi:hypothetical protein
MISRSGAAVYREFYSLRRWSHGGSWWGNGAETVKSGGEQWKNTVWTVCQGGGMTGYAKMVTQFHTIPHFLLLFCTPPHRLRPIYA